MKPEYYWQIMAQIDICDLDYVDFLAFCPLMVKRVHEVRIPRIINEIDMLHERVMAANEIIKEQNK